MKRKLPIFLAAALCLAFCSAVALSSASPAQEETFVPPEGAVYHPGTGEWYWYLGEDSLDLGTAIVDPEWYLLGEDSLDLGTAIVDPEWYLLGEDSLDLGTAIVDPES